MVNGAAIAAARGARQISQKALADALGVGEITIWRWENKPTRGLDYLTARRMAEVLEVEPESLFVHGPEAATASGTRG